MYVLDRQAAEEDSKKYITKCGDMMRDLIHDFALIEPTYDWDNRHRLTLIPGDMALARVFYGFGLAPLGDNYIDDDRFYKINLIESIEHAFYQGYNYAAGGSDYPVGMDITIPELDAFLKLSNIYSRITAATQGYIYMAKPGRMIEDAILETVSPRYAHAVALATARSQFTISVIYARKIDATSAGITPRVLYTLAGVTNGYIMQLIRGDKLIADKKDGLWNISTLSALAWLKSRDNCPDWVRKL